MSGMMARHHGQSRATLSEKAFLSTSRHMMQRRSFAEGPLFCMIAGSAATRIITVRAAGLRIVRCSGPRMMRYVQDGRRPRWYAAVVELRRGDPRPRVHRRL